MEIMEYTIATEITFFFFTGGLVNTSIYMTKLSMVHHKEKLDQNELHVGETKWRSACPSACI